MMKKFSKEKFLFAALFFLLGIFSVLSAEWIKEKIELRKSQSLAFEVFFPNLDSLFTDEMFDEDFSSGSKKPPLFRFSSTDNLKLEQREDEKFIYYEISLNGLNKDQLNIKVENGQIAISGTIEKKSEEGQSQTVFQSHFSRSFPAPYNADADRVQIENAEDKIVLKFPKV